MAAKKEWDELSSQLGQLSKLMEQEKHFKSLGLDQKLEDVRKLARGDQLFKRAREEALLVKERLGSLKESVSFDLAYLSEQSIKEIPNAASFSPLRSAFEDFGSRAKNLLTSIQKELEGLEAKMTGAENVWKEGKAKIESEMNTALNSLPELAGKPGHEIGRQFVQNQKQIEAIIPKQKNLEQYQKLIQELENERKSLLSEWNRTNNNQFLKMKEVVKRINSGPLKGKLRIDLQATGNRSALRAFLEKLDGIGSKKIEWVDKPEQLLMESFVSALRLGEEALLNIYREYGMSPGVAKQLAGLDLEKTLQLEEIQLFDSIEIRLNVAHGLAEEFKILRDLSTGQRCTAILYLLMLENEELLLVDQPEDNLDNAFIADRIVSEMREQKCKRQFLFATHNPNIPVFGDAEWIGALEAERSHTILRDEYVGSIDKESVQKAVEQILEGGKQAFETRRIKYGF